MKWIGVITGDIVGSSEILKAGERDKLLEVMKGTVEELNNVFLNENMKMNIYRGDSFQIIVTPSTLTVLISLLLRARLISNSTDNLRWDTRLGLGVGKGEYLTESISESDGQAFHLSGEAFDSLNKNSQMAIQTPDNDFNEELSVSTAFADDIISNWTLQQAQVFYLMIAHNLNQKDIATMTNRTPQSISKIYTAGKIPLVLNYYQRVFDKISYLINKKP